jgi:hypothetical protein
VGPRWATNRPVNSGSHCRAVPLLGQRARKCPISRSPTSGHVPGPPEPTNRQRGHPAVQSGTNCARSTGQALIRASSLAARSGSRSFRVQKIGHSLQLGVSHFLGLKSCSAGRDACGVPYPSDLTDDEEEEAHFRRREGSCYLTDAGW